MSLRLVTTRPYLYEEDIADLNHRVHLNCLHKYEIMSEVKEALRDGTFTKQDLTLMQSQIIPRDDMRLGNGDLFEDHQIEPLAGILYALGVTEVRTQVDVALMRQRSEHWREIPDQLKYFEIFGEGTLPRLMNMVQHLVTKQWDFKVLDSYEGIIPNTSNADFVSNLKHKEKIA
jgi:hypothetical protein